MEQIGPMIERNIGNSLSGGILVSASIYFGDLNILVGGALERRSVRKYPLRGYRRGICVEIPLAGVLEMEMY